MTNSPLSRALARNDERSHGDRLHDLLVEIDMVNEGAFSATEYDEQITALNNLATQFIAPHVHRIAELETRCATYEVSEGAWHEATNCHNGADALSMINGLRARIGELEAKNARIVKLLDMRGVAIADGAQREGALRDELVKVRSGLEAENASLREVGAKILAVHDALPTWPSRSDCVAAIDDVSPHIAQLSELLRCNQ
jgi:hypothetical protein